jgi:hypothetical protein
MAEIKNEGVMNTGSGNVVIGSGCVIGKGTKDNEKPSGNSKDPKK